MINIYANGELAGTAKKLYTFEKRNVFNVPFGDDINEFVDSIASDHIDILVQVEIETLEAEKIFEHGVINPGYQEEKVTFKTVENGKTTYVQGCWFIKAHPTNPNISWWWAQNINELSEKTLQSIQTGLAQSAAGQTDVLDFNLLAKEDD